MLKVYRDPKIFWAETSPHLSRDLARNCLSLGIASGFQSDPINCLYQSALFEGEHLLGTVQCSRHLGKHFFLPTPTVEESTAEKLFSAFRKAKVTIHCVVAELATAKQYQKLLHRHGLKSKVLQRQGLYRCTEVVPPEADPKVRFRLATMKDVRKISEWIETFQAEAVPHDPPVNGMEFAKSKIANKMIFVIEKAGRLLSMAAWSRDIETACSISLVFTPTAHRNKGYASLITARLTQFHLAAGKKETNLFTDLSNPTSNKIYQKIGYEFVCDFVHLGVKA